MNGRRESRRSQRFPIKMPLRYRIHGESDGEWRYGKTVNISSSGVYFRCPLSADRGTRVELNFLLQSSRSKDSGLEVSCKGEVVRLENAGSEESRIALAVRISDYRLFPFIPEQSNLREPAAHAELSE
jgi:PilZ domain